MTTPIQQTYSTADSSITINGIEITGFAGTPKYERDDDVVNIKKGNRGEVLHSINPSKAGTLAIPLLINSQSNGYLNSLYKAQQSGKSVPITGVMKNGLGHKRTMSGGMIVGEPMDSQHGGTDDPEDYEWKIHFALSERTLGGQLSTVQSIANITGAASDLINLLG